MISQTSFDQKYILFFTSFTNHLFTGIFVLIYFRRSVFPRIVNVSSTCSYYANIQFDDLQYAKAKYFTFYHVYAQSKLANLLFTSELQKMSDKNGWGLSGKEIHKYSHKFLQLD